MDYYMRSNLEHWNELTPIHERSKFYDVEGFKAGNSTLKSIELEELGDVSGKSLLHLQCHFGMDTMSWARLGARVTGVDFSDRAISLAHSLSKELGIEADFVCSNVYGLPNILGEKFDVVFTSYGVLCWLPDLGRWAEVIAHFLRPGGIFYMVEEHPITNVFDYSDDVSELKVTESYFHSPEPMKSGPEGSYADRSAKVSIPNYEWAHSLGDIVNALISVGLKIEFLHEFQVCSWQRFLMMKQDEAGWWRLKGDNIPLTFSLMATKDKTPGGISQ